MEEEVGKARAKYQGKTGMRLEATYYGQTVLTLDPTGTLEKIGKIKVGKWETIQSPTEATPNSG